MGDAREHDYYGVVKGTPIIWVYNIDEPLLDRPILMKDVFSKLIQLARVDAAIDILTESKEHLPTEIKEIEDKILLREKSFLEQKKDYEQLSQLKKKNEGGIQELNDWIADRESKQKEIKTNREYHAAIKETSSAKKNQSTLEEEVLKAASKMEELSKGVEDSQNKFQEEKILMDNEIASLQARVNSIDSEIDQEIKLRAEIEVSLDQVALTKYKMIKTRITPALAHVTNGICHECNTRIPPQMFIELQKCKHIVACPRCHRILHAETN